MKLIITEVENPEPTMRLYLTLSEATGAVTLRGRCESGDDWEILEVLANGKVLLRSWIGSNSGLSLDTSGRIKVLKESE